MAFGKQEAPPPQEQKRNLAGLWNDEKDHNRASGKLSTGGRDFYVRLYVNDKKPAGSKQPDYRIDIVTKNKDGKWESVLDG